MFQHLEDELLIENGIQVVTDRLGTVRLLAERCDNERVHVEGGAGNCAVLAGGCSMHACIVRTIMFRRQIRDLCDLQEKHTSDLGLVGELVGAQLVRLPLQLGQSELLAPLLPLLGLLRFIQGLVRALVVVVVLVVVLCALGAQQELVLVFVGARGLGDEHHELLDELVAGRVGVARVDEGELDLDLASHDRLLLAGAPGLKREPLGLLDGLGVLEDVLEDDVKLAHVVLAKAVLVPAAGLEQGALDADDGEVERGVPFWVQGFVDRGRGFAGISHVEDQVLQGPPSAAGPMQDCGSNCAPRRLTGSEVPLLSFAARFRPWGGC